MTSPHDWQTCFTCTGLPPIQKTILRPPHDHPGAEEDFRRPPEAETARHDRAGCEGVACGRTGRSLEGLLNFRPKFQEHKAISVRIHWGIAKKQVSVLAT